MSSSFVHPHDRKDCLYHSYSTPWKRVANYQAPSGMAACPPGGCICAWLWCVLPRLSFSLIFCHSAKFHLSFRVPDGCGEPNMYMAGFRCKVTGNTGNRRPAPAKPPVWCEGQPDKCTKGAKQMIAWNQASGNNIAVKGLQADGKQKSPGYNTKCGWQPGMLLFCVIHLFHEQFAQSTFLMNVGAQNDIFGDSGSSPQPAGPVNAASQPTTTHVNAPEPVHTTTKSSPPVQPPKPTTTTPHNPPVIARPAPTTTTTSTAISRPVVIVQPKPSTTSSLSPAHPTTTTASVPESHSNGGGRKGACKARRPHHQRDENVVDRSRMLYHKRAMEAKMEQL